MYLIQYRENERTRDDWQNSWASFNCIQSAFEQLRIFQKADREDENLLELRIVRR